MTPVIEQFVSFQATPAKLYELFMDSAKHSAATGMPAKVSRKVGGKWSAFGGMILEGISSSSRESENRTDVALLGMEKSGSRFHPRRRL